MCMYCPRCGSALPQGATYCTQCAAVVKPVDHIVKTIGRVTMGVVDNAGQAIDRAARAIEPVVDKTIKTIRPAIDETTRVLRPAAEKVVQVTKDAADKTAKAVGPAVEKVATATERVGKNLREKVQRKP